MSLQSRAHASRSNIYIAPINDDQSVLFNVQTGTYLRLNSTATRIFELDRAGRELTETAAEIAREWSIPIDRALVDTRNVMQSIETLSAARSTAGRVPSLVGVARVVLQWVDLPARRKLATAKVTLLVVLVELGLRTIDLDRLSRACRTPLVPTDGGGTPDLRPATADELSDREQLTEGAIRWVLGRWSFDATCLRYALALGFFLRRQQPTLRLGLVEDGSVAHAWVEVGGRIFNPLPVLSRFSSGESGRGAREKSDS
jgi:hypothetical protein